MVGKRKDLTKSTLLHSVSAGLENGHDSEELLLLPKLFEDTEVMSLSVDISDTVSIMLLSNEFVSRKLSKPVNDYRQQTRIKLSMAPYIPDINTCIKCSAFPA